MYNKSLSFDRFDPTSPGPYAERRRYAWYLVYALIMTAIGSTSPPKRHVRASRQKHSSSFSVFTIIVIVVIEHHFRHNAFIEQVKDETSNQESEGV